MMTLTALLLAHFIADFTFQPTRLAEAKQRKLRWLLLHGGIYGITVTFVCFLCIGTAAVWPALVLAGSHLLIDGAKHFLERTVLKGRGQLALFLADQALHLAAVWLVWRCCALEAAASSLWRQLCALRLFPEALVYGLILVMLWDPACVFIRKLFDGLSGGAERESFADEPKAGRIIGKLERLIIIVLVLSGQLGGIGFVLTAKSLARFKQFEQQGFAERYLVGTLASTALAILATLLLRSILLPA